MTRGDKHLVIDMFPTDTLSRGKNRGCENDRHEAIKLVRFCTAVAEYTVGKGRFFHPGHPLSKMRLSLYELDRPK